MAGTAGGSGGLKAAAAALGLLAGIALQLPQAALMAWPVAGTAAAVAALVFGLARRGGLAPLVVALGAATLGFASTAWRAEARLADRLDPVLEGRDIIATGVIAEMPRLTATGTRLLFAPESATLAGTPVRLPQRLSLAWYAGADDDTVLAEPAEALRAGQRWRLPLRLRLPHGNLNPHGFDLELWLFERGIGGTGSVRSHAGSVALKLADTAAHPVERLRQRVRDSITATVADADAAGVIAALAIGDQAAIDRHGWDLYRQTGLAHLLSVSGLHVTVFSWLAAALIGRLWRLHPPLSLRLPAPHAARWGGLACAAGYALLAGWGVPAQRTVAMIAVVLLLRSAGRRWPLPAVLLAAALAVALADPWALLQPGFWLSFVAVALLFAAEPAQPAPRGNSRMARVTAVLRTGLRTQLVATVALAPLSLLFFQQFSIVGFVANLVAIPLVTLLIVPLALLGMVAAPLWLPAAGLVQALNAVLLALAGWPAGVWTAAAAPPWAVAAGLLGGSIVVLPLPWRQRGCGLLLMLPLLAPPVARPGHGDFELVAADVGQGSAVLLRTRTQLLLYDTGPAWTADADAGSRLLLPLLRARGEPVVHRLVLSHGDADHTGGAAALIEALPVHELLASLPEGHALWTSAAARGARRTRCAAGQGWTWDGVRFDVLHPPPALHAAAPKANAVSCVLRVQGARHSVLLAGDVEAAQEAALVQAHGAALRADVALVPHHGSRTSSTPAFVVAVAPRVALVQAGYLSRFGHPAPDVVARWATRGAAVVRSDRCGAWSWRSDAGDAAGSGTCEREVRRRYWHHRFASEARTPP